MKEKKNNNCTWLCDDRLICCVGSFLLFCFYSFSCWFSVLPLFGRINAQIQVRSFDVNSVWCTCLCWPVYRREPKKNNNKTSSLPFICIFEKKNSLLTECSLFQMPYSYQMTMIVSSCLSSVTIAGASKKTHRKKLSVNTRRLLYIHFWKMIFH